jgi:hypothetical protein
MVNVILSGQMSFEYSDDEVEGMTKNEIIAMAEEEFYDSINNIFLEVEDYEDSREEEDE